MLFPPKHFGDLAERWLTRINSVYQPPSLRCRIEGNAGRLDLGQMREFKGG
jgi:hypothetical protein